MWGHRCGRRIISKSLMFFTTSSSVIIVCGGWHWVVTFRVIRRLLPASGYNNLCETRLNLRLLVQGIRLPYPDLGTPHVHSSDMDCYQLLYLVLYFSFFVVLTRVK